MTPTTKAACEKHCRIEKIFLKPDKIEPLEETLEVIHIIVLIANHFTIAQLAAIINAGVVFFVTDDIVCPPDNRTNNTQI